MRTNIYNNKLSPDLQGGVGVAEFFSPITHCGAPDTVNPNASSWGGDETKYKQPFAVSGRLMQMRVQLNDIPGVGDSYTFTIRRNGADAGGIEITISDSETYGEDLTNTVEVTAGDLMAFKCVPTAGADLVSAHISIVFESDEVQKSIILGGGDLLVSALLADRAFRLISSDTSNDLSSSPEFVDLIMPTSGFLKNLYVHFENARGGLTVTNVTVYVNGSPTLLAVAMGASDTDKTNLVDSVYVNTGDKVLMAVVWTNAGTVPDGIGCSWSLEFNPDLDEESVFACVNLNSNPSATLTVHTAISTFAASAEWSAYDSDLQTVVEAIQFYNLIVEFDTAPGAGKSRQVGLAVNGVPTALAVTITDAGVLGTNSTDVISVNAGDIITFFTIPTGTPTGPGQIRISMVSKSLEDSIPVQDASFFFMF